MKQSLILLLHTDFNKMFKFCLDGQEMNFQTGKFEKVRFFLHPEEFFFLKNHNNNDKER